MEVESYEGVDPKTVASGKNREDSSKREKGIVIAIALRARWKSPADFVSIFCVDSPQRPDH